VFRGWLFTPKRFLQKSPGESSGIIPLDKQTLRRPFAQVEGSKGRDQGWVWLKVGHGIESLRDKQSGTGSRIVHEAVSFPVSDEEGRCPANESFRTVPFQVRFPHQYVRVARAKVVVNMKSQIRDRDLQYSARAEHTPGLEDETSNLGSAEMLELVRTVDFLGRPVRNRFSFSVIALDEGVFSVESDVIGLKEVD